MHYAFTIDAKRYNKIGLGASGSAAKLQPSPGPGGRARKARNRASPAQARCPRGAAPGASPPDGGCSGLAHAAASAKGYAGPRSPGRPGGRRRGRAAGGAAAAVASAWGKGPLLTRAGRLRLRRPGRLLGGPSLRRGPAAAALESQPPAGPAPPPCPTSVLRAAPQTRPRLLPSPPQRYVAVAPTSRDSLPSARGRAGPAGRAALGGRQGRGCACVDVCAGGGREGGERQRGRARARARPRSLPSPAPPPNRDPDTSLRPPPRHPGRWERRRACAALGPARAHLFGLLPQYERSAAQITASSPRHPRPLPLRPLPGAQKPGTCPCDLLLWRVLGLRAGKVPFGDSSSSACPPLPLPPHTSVPGRGLPTSVTT
ncbi:collagen alpha-1(I) chain-like [Cebus imitator]|uniref:collagen alpha-1(I) chain-like n=1 Tax=Cebus imitator TaxID=2715852 RepID=UPI00080A2259|nr:collagen alpha-1(I) chain-like [Cebus imitator]